MKLVITGPARADLSDIGAWIAKDSAPKSGELCQRVGTALPGPDNPVGQISVVLNVEGRSIRRCVHGADLVFFEIQRAAAIVRVLRILHSARDYADLFGDADGFEDVDE